MNLVRASKRLGHRVSRVHLGVCGGFVALLIILTWELVTPSHAQQTQGFPSEKSISLTIWGAGLSLQSTLGRRWDTQSAPDGLVRVYLGDRLMAQSHAKRNTLQPMWALTVGPIPESRFYEGPLVIQVMDQDLLGEELIEELDIPRPSAQDLARVLRLEGKELKPLIYQWVDTTPPAPKRNGLRLGERRFIPDDFDGKGGETLGQESEEDRAIREQSRRQRSAKRASKASSLYRAYLKAQFSGDQLLAHRILLRLAMQYSSTRHGRKARRIMLLDGR